MKKRWESGSELVEKLFNNIENYKKIEHGCNKTCNEILRDEAVDFDELYHAKAVLEQKIEARKSYQNMLSNTFSFVAIILSAMAVVISALKGNVDKIDIGCLTIFIIVACSMIYYFGDSSPINKYMYYVYSLICTEIEDRKSCNENVRNKNKKGKKKKGKKK